MTSPSIPPPFSYHCPRCGEPKHFAAPQCHLCYQDDLKRLANELRTTLAAPHPTWCKSRQDQPCSCYQARVREALKELEPI